MSEVQKKDNKHDKKEIPEEVKKPERTIRLKYIDLTKGPVASDNIRKEINNSEKKIVNNWDGKYDHLRGEFFGKVLAEECLKVGIPVDTFVRKLPENLIEKSPISLKDSPMPVPRTSSAIVGWRSSQSKYSLEFVGPFHISAKHTIEPPLIPGEFRVTQQKFIYLG